MQAKEQIAGKLASAEQAAKDLVSAIDGHVQALQTATEQAKDLVSAIQGHVQALKTLTNKQITGELRASGSDRQVEKSNEDLTKEHIAG